MTKVLYQNDEWELQLCGETHYIEERGSGRYWFFAKDVARHVGEDETTIYHVGSKTWVGLPLFEDVVRKTIAMLKLEPKFDLDEEFRILAIEKSRRRLPAGLYKPSEIPDAVTL